jgi:hypothetical protein
MTHVIRLRDEFGPRLSDGAEAYRFRVSAIDKYLSLPHCERVILDFTGVRSANSSFVNGLVSGLFEQHGAAALRKLVFKGCLPTIQVLVQSAVDLGMIKHSERVS